jgi:hypothetical protein
MPQHRFAVLRSDLAREMDHVGRLAAEAAEWQPRLAEWPEVVRTRTAGGILHDFYSGVERIFRMIATRVDEDLPGGPDWHVQLLQRMATDVKTVRPAVLPEETVRQLDRYLRFRHLFRHSYGFDLEWARCSELLGELPLTYQRLAEQLAIFDEFLRTLERET